MSSRVGQRHAELILKTCNIFQRENIEFPFIQWIQIKVTTTHKSISQKTLFLQQNCQYKLYFSVVKVSDLRS